MLEFSADILTVGTQKASNYFDPLDVYPCILYKALKIVSYVAILHNI